MAGDSDEDTYELELSGGGLALKRAISADAARAIINIVMGGNPGGAAAPPPQVYRAPAGAGGEGSPAGAPGRLSLREYLDDCEATRNPDKITAIGNFLIEYEAADDFTREDLKSRFRSAGEAPPANFPRDFTLALRAGWIAEDANAPGKFYVTQKGRSAISAKFSADVKRAASKPRGSRRPRRREDCDGGGDDE